MIWLDDEGRIVIRSNYNHQSVENMVNYQKAIIHLLQTQNSDLVAEETTYNALELLEHMLFEPDQVCIKDVYRENLRKEMEQQNK